MELRQPVRRHSKARLFLFDCVEGLCARLGGRAFYAWHSLRPGRLRLRREKIEAPLGLAGLTLAHLSDFHAGRLLDARSLAGVVDQVLRLKPDLVAFTGDFVAHEVEAGLALAEVLAPLAQVPLGAFAVFGNHDYRGRREGLLVEALSAKGWRFLRNEGVPLLDGRLWLTGVEDPEEGRHLGLASVRTRRDGQASEICLCHNPSAAPALADPQVLAILAGHSHGRQLDLPFLRTLGPRHPGSRVDLGATRLIVSNGIGVVGVPLRVGAPAEIVLVELTGPSPPSA